MWCEWGPLVSSHLRYGDRLLSYIVMQPAEWEEPSEKQVSVKTLWIGLAHKNMEVEWKTRLFLLHFILLTQSITYQSTLTLRFGIYDTP